MTQPKYELTDDSKVVVTLSGNGWPRQEKQTTVYRIRATRSFAGVKEGDLGGFVETTDNLDTEPGSSCWIGGDAVVMENARVGENAWVCGQALISGSARIYGLATVCGQAQVKGQAQVFDNATVMDLADVFNDARVSGNATVKHSALVIGSARVYGSANITGIAQNDDEISCDAFERELECG